MPPAYQDAAEFKTWWDKDTEMLAAAIRRMAEAGGQVRVCVLADDRPGGGRVLRRFRVLVLWESRKIPVRALAEPGPAPCRRCSR